MTATPPPESWAERNQRLLVAEFDRLHAAIGDGRAPTGPVGPDPDTRLSQVVALFRLSDFERDLLVWCAAAELDARFSPPTYAAALASLSDAHWDALAPSAPLRRWRLVELGAGTGLVERPLRIDERVLHHLAGVACLDARLDGIVRPGREDGERGLLTPAQEGVADDLAATLLDRTGPVVVLLDGAQPETRERVAGRIAASLGLLLLVVSEDRIPLPGPDNAALARLVEREVALLGGLPMVTCQEPGRAAAAFVAELGCPVVVAGVAALPDVRWGVRRTVPSPDEAEQVELWRRVLGDAADTGEVARAAASFRFDVADIEAVARDARDAGEVGLHHASRVRARGGLSELADYIEPRATWDDVVLPEAALRALRDISGQVRHRVQVYQDWGMAGSSARGLGVTALFTGESGTGKTLAAEVLGAELDLDLYRIDLAGVVSKYIGETEKNLKRVFDAADASGAVLLFDEADAIFGKRSEVRDSHDRYANLEVSYLLQRMETYRGLAILTTNLKSSLDRAFLRRIRFVVTFPFPDQAARARIWQLMFPSKVPVSELDWHKLARLQLAGGHIRTIALGAAFLAAEDGGPVTMGHVLAAARREYAKLEKPLTETEIGGWT
jgi:AAA+ superfamily predicted ATPase